MTIQQITVFIENESGALIAMAEELAKAGVDMYAMLIADANDYGILRMIVSDTEKALEVLKTNGHIARVTPVLGVDVMNSPGGLVAALAPLAKAGINVEYVYAFTAPVNNRACVVIRVDDNDKATAVLEAAGINPISESDFRGN